MKSNILMSFYSRSINLSGLDTKKTPKGVWFRRCVLVTSEPDLYNTIISPRGFVGRVESIIVDNDHLLRDTKARFSSGRVEVVDGRDELVADLFIPLNKAVRWLDKNQSRAMTVDDVETDLTGISVYFDNTAYPNETYVNKDGRKMFNRYNLPYTSVLFGNAQGQPLASLGDREFETGVRSLIANINNNSTMHVTNKRCFCLEYSDPKIIYVNPENNQLVKVMSATETSVSIMDLLTDEQSDITSDMPEWDIYEAVDMTQPIPYIVEAPSPDSTDPLAVRTVEVSEEELEKEINEMTRACIPCDAQKAKLEAMKKAREIIPPVIPVVEDLAPVAEVVEAPSPTDTVIVDTLKTITDTLVSVVADIEAIKTQNSTNTSLTPETVARMITDQVRTVSIDTKPNPINPLSNNSLNNTF